MTDFIKAKAAAAQLCLDILAANGLIGEELVTKLAAARAAILESLPKMYAACNAIEKQTGKNMFQVCEVVVQVYARAKWVDHDAMMTKVEALLVAFVEEAKAKAEAEAAPTPLEVTELAAPDRDWAQIAKEAMIERIESRLKADGVDFFNEGAALECLGECVAPTKLKAVCLEELAQRRAVTFGLEIGRRVHTTVGPAVVVEFDKWNPGEVKIKFEGDRGCTTTHHSKVLPC